MSGSTGLWSRTVGYPTSSENDWFAPVRRGEDELGASVRRGGRAHCAALRAMTSD